MRLSLFPLTPHHHCHTAIPLFTYSSNTTARTWPRMATAAAFHRRKDKVLVIMGATGSGKSRLSVDLATLFFPGSEIINSDKMQVYNGLETTTNKIPPHERNGVPHHLLGDILPAAGEFSPSDFRHRAGEIISDVVSRGKLPMVVGGSNSFIHALLVERFDPELNVFDDDSVKISNELRYDCCFLWVDISFAVLSDYLLKRVDDMVDSGMVDELAEFFDPDSPDLELESEKRSGLRKAIGVAEFDRVFKEYPPGGSCRGAEDPLRKGAYEKAVRAIKDNTCQLARRQIEKIMRLKAAAGWDLRRIDATEAFRALMTSGRHGSAAAGERWSDLWERDVLEPSVKIVRRFLME